jgi:hypothetical protein
LYKGEKEEGWTPYSRREEWGAETNLNPIGSWIGTPIGTTIRCSMAIERERERRAHPGAETAVSLV